MKPALHVVPRTKTADPKPYDELKGRKRMIFLKSQLMAASVQYALHGHDGTQNDRIRTASDLSGIPRTLIESEVKRQG
jgi:hypothetical protein